MNQTVSAQPFKVDVYDARYDGAVGVCGGETTVERSNESTVGAAYIWR